MIWFKVKEAIPTGISFHEFLFAAGFTSAVNGVYTHNIGYSVIVDKDSVTIKDSLDFDMCYKGDKQGAREWLEEVLDL